MVRYGTLGDAKRRRRVDSPLQVLHQLAQPRLPRRLALQRRYHHPTHSILRLLVRHAHVRPGHASSPCRHLPFQPPLQHPSFDARDSLGGARQECPHGCKQPRLVASLSPPAAGEEVVCESDGRTVRPSAVRRLSSASELCTDNDDAHARRG